jgi:capsular exopolysaccharide synthesis family protein
LRTNIDFLRATRRLTSIAVTSAAPNAGKSLTVANLGLIYALAGVNTLIVDADLRRPSQHRIFAVDNRQGLTSGLSRDHGALESATVSGPIDPLRILPSGPLPPNPTELLSAGRFSAALAHLQTSADLILIDTPPVLSYAEASILARDADGVMFVVRPASSSRRLEKKAAQHLRAAGADLIGAILNDSKEAFHEMYYV